MTNRGENYTYVIQPLLGSRPGHLGVSTVSCANFPKTLKPHYGSWRPPMFHVKTPKCRLPPPAGSLDRLVETTRVMFHVKHHTT